MKKTNTGINLREDLTPEEDLAVGSLIGTFVGDALGMPVEGRSHRWIKQHHGSMSAMVDARLGKGTYTDDTQMMVATVKSILSEEGIVTEALADSYLEHFDEKRGYGRGTKTVFKKWVQGEDVREASKQVFDGGSYGNGGSMRIAPVGLLFSGDPRRLERAVRCVCGLTHAHPLGIGSSFLQAYSVAKAFRYDRSGGINPYEWVDDLLVRLPEDLNPDGVLSDKLETIQTMLRSRPAPAEPGAVVEQLGCTSKAFESVPASIYAFLSNEKSFELALLYAVGIGGDTDTIGAMTGAIAGAYHGVGSVPDRWWEVLENGPDGRDDVVEMGREWVELTGENREVTVPDIPWD